MYLGTGDPGAAGGSTYTGSGEYDRTLSMHDNLFGPAGNNVRQDSQRNKRHQRKHLSDLRIRDIPEADRKEMEEVVKTRIEGLITDSTKSPFTRNILPYVYMPYPDQKIKWHVYSFDEGIASRVPYESAARVLPRHSGRSRATPCDRVLLSRWSTTS